MRGCLILDNRGLIVWLGKPVVGRKEDHVGKPAWVYSATEKDAIASQLAWAKALHTGQTTKFEINTIQDIANCSWHVEYQRIDTHPVVACEYWQVVVSPLSPRELEIARLFSSDWKSGEIAEKLGISTHTVETVRQRILAKLQVRGAAGITKWLLRAGLIEL